MNPIFKQVQRLPELTPALTAGELAAQTFDPARARLATQPKTRPATPPAPVRHSSWPRTGQCTGERALFAVLGLSALFGVGQALATMMVGAPNGLQFTAWVAQLLA